MEFVIDRSIWRCGGKDDSNLPPNTNKRGKGDTSLLNIEGYMCCLGQCALQLGYEKHYLLNIGEPMELPVIEEIPDYEILHGVDNRSYGGNDQYYNTDLSTKAMDINDNTKTTPEEKEEELIELFEEYGHTIKFINQFQTNE